jgi:hypothetical protein
MGTSPSPKRYVVVAFERQRAVCEVASMGLGLRAWEASTEVPGLREEFPGALIAILPAASYGTFGLRIR